MSAKKKPCRDKILEINAKLMQDKEYHFSESEEAIEASSPVSRYTNLRYRLMTPHT